MKWVDRITCLTSCSTADTNPVQHSNTPSGCKAHLPLIILPLICELPCGTRGLSCLAAAAAVTSSGSPFAPVGPFTQIAVFTSDSLFWWWFWSLNETHRFRATVDFSLKETNASLKQFHSGQWWVPVLQEATRVWMWLSSCLCLQREGSKHGCHCHFRPDLFVRPVFEC